mmetsp:Transcript_14067/g.27318  ORF Transcript_14067/g.27318 Transcript_14067/m.27318 type:complete len:208 (-) Transcript_14067:1292-1915(-)
MHGGESHLDHEDCHVDLVLAALYPALANDGTSLVHGLNLDHYIALEHNRSREHEGLIGPRLCLRSRASMHCGSSTLGCHNACKSEVEDEVELRDEHTEPRSAEDVLYDCAVRSSRKSCRATCLKRVHVSPGMLLTLSEVLGLTVVAESLGVSSKQTLALLGGGILRNGQLVIELRPLIVSAMLEDFCETLFYKKLSCVALALTRVDH